MSLTAWLRRLLVPADATDAAWKPTGLKFTTARDYEEHKAVAGYHRSRTRTATGRRYQRPVKVKPHAAEVVAFRRKEGR